eukprot:835307-Amorphochlora_amoeboformis.AAC.1
MVGIKCRRAYVCGLLIMKIRDSIFGDQCTSPLPLPRNYKETLDILILNSDITNEGLFFGKHCKLGQTRAAH